MRHWQVRWSHGPQGSSWHPGSFSTGMNSVLYEFSVYLPLYLVFTFCLLAFPPLCAVIPEVLQKLCRAGLWLLWLMKAGQKYVAQTLWWICWLKQKLKCCHLQEHPLLQTLTTCLAGFWKGRKVISNATILLKYFAFSVVNSVTLFFKGTFHRSGWLHPTCTFHASSWAAWFWWKPLEKRLSTGR